MDPSPYEFRSAAGLPMEEARAKVVDRMKELGLLAKVEPHRNRVGKSYRSKAVIEPYMSPLCGAYPNATSDAMIRL